MNIYSESKSDVKLRCDYCITFPQFEGAQEVLSRLMVVLHVTTPQHLQSTPALHEEYPRVLL
jgi:hypothetical protein